MNVTPSSPLFWIMTTLGLILLYWGISQLHTKLCTPDGLYGLLFTAISMSSPICQAIITLLSHVSSMYILLWGSLVGSIISISWKLLEYTGIRGVREKRKR